MSAASEPSNPYQIRIIDNSISGNRLWTWRIPQERTAEAKSQVNYAHKLYKSGLMNLTDYTTEAIKFLHGSGHSGGYGPDYDQALESVQAFILSIIDSLHDKTFHPGPQFATKLERAFEEYKRGSGQRRTQERYLEYIQTLKDAPERSWLDCGDDKGNGLSAIQYRITKAGIETAFANFMNPKALRGWGQPLLESRLITAVFQFAKGKIEGNLWELPEAYVTADDFAQDVSMKVMNGLNKFVGGPGEFYAWVKQICFTTGVDAFKEIEAEFEGRVPLFTENEDGEMELHPDIVKQYILNEEPWHWVPAYIAPPDLKTLETLPSWLKGTDRVIAEGRKAGKKHKQLAQETGLSPEAVRQAASRLTKTLGKWMKGAEAKSIRQAKADAEANFFPDTEE